MNHEEKQVWLKHGPAMIDAGICDFVSFLDSFVSVRTLWSCQGLNTREREPYVTFLSSHEDAVAIYKTFHTEKNKIFFRIYFDIDYWGDPLGKPLRYTIRFDAWKTFEKNMEAFRIVNQKIREERLSVV